MDLRTATNYLGYTFEGYPEEPITKMTYDQAVADGILTNWKDSNGAIPAPTWSEIVVAYTSGQEPTQKELDRISRRLRIKGYKNSGGGATVAAIKAAIKDIAKELAG